MPVLQRVAADSLVARATLFSSRVGRFAEETASPAAPEPWGHPLLPEMESGFRQLRLLFDYAPLVEESEDPTEPRGMFILPSAFGSRSRITSNYPTVVSMEMRSPLAVVIEIPSIWQVGGLAGLLMLAERLCTFGPRVSARRARYLREQAEHDEARRRIREQRADTLAEVARRDRKLQVDRILDRIDLLDPEEPDDAELEEWRK